LCYYLKKKKNRKIQKNILKVYLFSGNFTINIRD